MDNWKLITIICIVVCYIITILVNELLKNKGNSYREFLEKMFGKCGKVIDAKTSDGFEYQILVFPDNDVSYCYKIITDGLRKYKKLNTEYQLLIEKHMDIYSLDNEWLFEIINELAKEKREKNTLIVKMSCLAKTPFAGGMVLPALFASFEKVDGLVVRGKKIKLLRFVPLYEEEISCVKAKGWATLAKHFLGEDGLGIIDDTRFNYNDGRKIKIQEILNRKPGTILYNEISTYIINKAVNNKRMNKVEKNLDYVISFNNEVCSKGIHSYLTKEMGNNIHKVVKSFKDIARPRLYTLIYEMYVLLGAKDIPLDRAERKKYIDKLCKDEKFVQALEEWENKYINMGNVQSDDQTKYILDNKDKFKE